MLTTILNTVTLVSTVLSWDVVNVILRQSRLETRECFFSRKTREVV